MNQSANNKILKPNKKQTTQFIVTNNYSGTKNLSDILAKLALTEIGNVIVMEEKPDTNVINS